ncbi:MAG: polysaccharide deacetylase family protein, partial [Actinobacteria bacterium]|nr:polysaccharide deacetylase family protein [Actinomycetota bacterium]
MLTVKIIGCAVVFLLVAGCGSVQVGGRVTDSLVKTPDNVSTEDRTMKIPGTGPETNFNKGNTKQVMSLQPETRQFKSQIMNFEILDKLDNTKYAWWIALNRQHKTPGIPSIAQRLITKYGGIYIGDTTKKIVYLTFDEGYENGYTIKILDTLKEDKVKSLFFVTGPYIKEHGDLVKRMLEEGHLVGNHTISHPSLPTLGDASLENELYGLEKQFGPLTGKGFKYMRPPRGEYSEKVLAAAKELGYKTVFWSYAYDDFDINKQKGPEHAHKMVMDNSIFLILHFQFYQ